MAFQREVFGAFLTILLLQVILSVYGAAFLVAMPFWNEIYPGASIKGIALDGMSREEAANNIKSRIQVKMPPEVVLRNGEEYFKLNLQKAGLTFDPNDSAERAFRRGREGSALGYLRIKNQKEEIPICLNLDEDQLASYLTTLKEGTAEGGNGAFDSVEKVREALRVFFSKFYGYPVEIL